VRARDRKKALIFALIGVPKAYDNTAVIMALRFDRGLGARVSEGDGSAGPSRRHAARGSFHTTTLCESAPMHRVWVCSVKRVSSSRCGNQKGLRSGERLSEAAAGVAQTLESGIATAYK
jgi:hypothetical protein